MLVAPALRSSNPAPPSSAVPHLPRPSSVRDVCRYHAAASGSVARHETVHTSCAFAGGVAPRAVMRSAASKVRVCPALSANATVPLERTVTPLGSAGWSGIGGSDAPGGSDGVGAGVGETDGDGEAPVVAAGDADAVREAVGVETGVDVAVGCAVVAAGVAVDTATAVGVARGVADAVMRSVSEHAAITHRTRAVRMLRTWALRVETRRVRCSRAHAYMTGSRSG